MSIASPNASSDAAAAAAVDSSAAACGAKNAAWRSAVGTICYVPYKYAFNPELIVWNANRVHAFILANWHFSFLAVAVYIALIHALRAHMQSRKPLELRTPLLIWNLALAVFSTFGALRIGEEAAHVFMRRGLHDTICVTYSPHSPAGVWQFLFCLSKIFELVDTIFIVLRKKPLIFLHYYHHSTVLITVWEGSRTLISASRLFTLMNFSVHSIMFTYYALATTRRFRPPRTAAMFVTTFQNLQMLLGVGVALYIAKIRFFDRGECNVANESLALCAFIYLTFGILFVRFFLAAYVYNRRSNGTKAEILEQKKEKAL